MYLLSSNFLHKKRKEWVQIAIFASLKLKKISFHLRSGHFLQKRFRAELSKSNAKLKFSKKSFFFVGNNYEILCFIKQFRILCSVDLEIIYSSKQPANTRTKRWSCEIPLKNGKALQKKRRIYSFKEPKQAVFCKFRRIFDLLLFMAVFLSHLCDVLRWFRCCGDNCGKSQKLLHSKSGYLLRSNISLVSQTCYCYLLSFQQKSRLRCDF